MDKNEKKEKKAVTFFTYVKFMLMYYIFKINHRIYGSKIKHH